MITFRTRSKYKTHMTSRIGFTNKRHELNGDRADAENDRAVQKTIEPCRNQSSRAEINRAVQKSEIRLFICFICFFFW